MQAQKYLGKLIGQSNLLGRWYGNLQMIAQHTNIYIQFLILGFSGTAAYVGISSIVHGWGYQLPFWQFVLGVILILVVLSLFVWRLQIPSTFESWNFQWWENNNPLRGIVEKQAQDINEMRKQMNRMEATLNMLTKEKNADERISEICAKKG